MEKKVKDFLLISGGLVVVILASFLSWYFISSSPSQEEKKSGTEISEDKDYDVSISNDEIGEVKSLAKSAVTYSGQFSNIDIAKEVSTAKSEKDVKIINDVYELGKNKELYHIDGAYKIYESKFLTKTSEDYLTAVPSASLPGVKDMGIVTNVDIINFEDAEKSPLRRNGHNVPTAKVDFKATVHHVTTFLPSESVGWDGEVTVIAGDIPVEGQITLYKTDNHGWKVNSISSNKDWLIKPYTRNINKEFETPGEKKIYYLDVNKVLQS